MVQPAFLALTFAPIIVPQKINAQEVSSTDAQVVPIVTAPVVIENQVPNADPTVTTPAIVTETSTLTVATPDPIVPTPTVIVEPVVAPIVEPVVEPAVIPLNTTPSLESDPSPPVESTILSPSQPPVSEPSAVLIVPSTEKISLTNGQQITVTTSSDWNIDETNGTAVSKEPVKLGVKYIFPLESNVTLTFKSLPANESLRAPLRIVKVRVGDLKLSNDIKPYGEFAYDITTGMTDGTFDYDLTLPKPSNGSVDVMYMEDRSSTPLPIADNQLVQQGSTVKANNVDHFTIFVVINPILTGATCVSAGATTGTGCYSTIQAAIDASSNGDTIEIESDISLTQRVQVNKDVTIDGNGFTISPAFTYTNTSNNASFGILSNGVTLKNLTIDGTLGTNLHGINIYESTGVLLDNVRVLSNDKAGVVVNGSMVTVNNIQTSGNGWGGINVDLGVGVTTQAQLTVNGTSTHAEPNNKPHIWIDDTTKNVSVIDTLTQYDIQNKGSKREYTLKSTSTTNPSASLEQCRNGAAGTPNDCLSLAGSMVMQAHLTHTLSKISPFLIVR